MNLDTHFPRYEKYNQYLTMGHEKVIVNYTKIAKLNKQIQADVSPGSKRRSK